MGYADGVLSAQTIATLRGIPSHLAVTQLREAGVLPAQHSVTWANPQDLPEVRVELDALDDALRAMDGPLATASEPEAG